MGFAVEAEERGDEMKAVIDTEVVKTALAGVYKSGKCIFFKR